MRLQKTPTKVKLSDLLIKFSKVNGMMKQDMKLIIKMNAELFELESEMHELKNKNNGLEKDTSVLYDEISRLRKENFDLRYRLLAKSIKPKEKPRSLFNKLIWGD